MFCFSEFFVMVFEIGLKIYFIGILFFLRLFFVLLKSDFRRLGFNFRIIGFEGFSCFLLFFDVEVDVSLVVVREVMVKVEVKFKSVKEMFERK